MLDNPPLLSPYILPWKVTDNTTENIAVLLVDSQGLTDHGANAALNDAILGLIWFVVGEDDQLIILQVRVLSAESMILESSSTSLFPCIQPSLLSSSLLRDDQHIRELLSEVL